MNYNIIMNALGYDIMPDIIYSYYQIGAYIIIISISALLSRKKLESTAIVDSLLQRDSRRYLSVSFAYFQCRR